MQCREQCGEEYGERYGERFLWQEHSGSLGDAAISIGCVQIMANQPNIAVIQMHSQVLSGKIPNLASSRLSILITCSTLVCEGE